VINDGRVGQDTESLKTLGWKIHTNTKPYTQVLQFRYGMNVQNMNGMLGKWSDEIKKVHKSKFGYGEYLNN